MSAMSASPVKPILSQGVPGGSVSNVVTPPTTASPTAKSMMTNSPVKQASLNHAVPLSLISEHKVQSLPPPAVQPLPRTPEKPREPPPRPTSNGVEPTVAGSILPPQEHPHSLLLPPLKPDDGFPAAVSNNAPPCPAVATVADKQPSDSLGSPSFNTGGSATDLTATSFRPSEQQGPISSKPELEVKVPPVPLRQPLSIPITTPAPICTPLPLPSAPAIPPSSQASALPPLTDLPLPIPAPTPTLTPTRIAEQHASPLPPTTTPAVVEQPIKARNEVTAPMIKVATIPRGTKRKRETKGTVSALLPTLVSKKEVAMTNSTDDRKSKRLRLPTQPYQSPLPELTLIAKINKMTPTKAPDDKLIVFYRNEFLAVRNAEGSFYICQAMQNIYKSSPRIRIRWLSLEAGDLYSPDFYDTTDFDCILTNLNMERVEKEKFRLPSDELHRTESILKRALDVEKGVQEKPSVTEEHPDGLDLSLFRDESQLKKPGKTVNKSPKTDNQIIPSKDTFEFEESSSSGEEKKKKKKSEGVGKVSGKKKKPIKKKPPPFVAPKKIIVPPVKPVVTVPVSTKSKEPAVVTLAKKVVVSTPTPPVETPPPLRSAVKRKLPAIPPVIEKRAKKMVLPETATPVPDRTSKTRSVGSAGHKSAAVVSPAPLAEKTVQSFVIKTKPLVRKVMERARRGVPVTTTTASTSKTRKK